MKFPRCSIIIRAFNEEKHIGKLISGIKKQSFFNDLEIILVDSGSTDETAQIAQAMGATVVEISPRDFSFGRALNLGCKHAKGEFLVLASAHVYPVYDNWIEKMLTPFEDEHVALVYGRQIGNEATKYSERQIFKKWFPEISCIDQAHPFCNNANAAIRKSLWLQLPYDEVLTGLEDLAWAQQMQTRGFKVAYQSEATIVHVHEESLVKIKNRYRREAIALKRIMPQHTFNFFDFVRLALANIISDAFHAIHERVFWKSIGTIILFRMAQFWGTFQGFKTKGHADAQLRQRFYYPNNFKRKDIVEPEPGARIDYYEYELQN